MKVINLIQGGPEWLEARAKYRTASEAPAMMGASSHTSRPELMRQKATGDTPEVSPQLQRVFDKGHEVEAKARPIIEGRIGDTLYPVTVVDDDDYLLASLDGMTMNGCTIWECKQWNAEKAEDVRNGIVPACDYWQVAQQLHITGAVRCVYTITDGTDEGTISTTMQLPPKDADRLMAGWRQFDADLAEYQPRERKAEATGNGPGTLPKLHIEVRGEVMASNVQEFRENALAVINGINTDLATDQDFADAEATVKWAKDVESRLQAAKDHALAQTEDLDQLFRTIDEIREHTRKTRLDLEKSVKTRKESIRDEIRNDAVHAIRAHYASLNQGLGITLGVPADAAQSVADAMKGKRTVDSLRDAADQAVTDAKLAASETAERVRRNLQRLDEIASDYPALFPDREHLVMKATEDMEAAAKSRIAEHQEQERKRREAEEQRKAEQQRKQAEAEADRASREEHREHAAAQVDDAPQAPAETAQCEITPDDPQPTLKIGDVNARLGLSLTGEFIESTLGVAAMDKKGRTTLYHERDFDRICDALIHHIAAVRNGAQRQAA